MKNSMMMTSVSALALASVSTGVATAEEAAVSDSGKYTLSFEGTFGRLDNAPADKWGASGGPGDKFGGQALSYGGALSLQRDVGENRDVRFGLSFGGTPSNIESFSSDLSSGFLNFSGGSGFYSSSLTNDLSFGAMDADMGVTRNVGGGNLRLFGGVRGLGIQSSSVLETDKTGSGFNSGQYLDADFKFNSSFVGVGPRVGASFSTGPKAGGLGFSAEIAAAAIFGTRNDDYRVNVESSSGGPNSGFSQSRSSSETVMNVDGKLSVDYYFSEKAKLSMGYQARQFWNVDGFSDSDFPRSSPRLVDGVMIGFTTTF